jgi:hypothetical protein
MAARASASARRETDRLLERIRTLVERTNRGDGARGAIVRAQQREIECLKSQLAEIVKRNPTGREDDPAGAEPSQTSRERP